MSAGMLPPWLVIVHRDEDRLYRHLRKAFESDSRVTVLKDRRHADRRRRAQPMGTDRRRSDRRLPLAAREERIWQSLRFHLIHRDENIAVYQAANEPPERAQPTATTKAERPAGRARGAGGPRRSVGSPRRAPRRGGR